MAGPDLLQRAGGRPRALSGHARRRRRHGRGRRRIWVIALVCGIVAAATVVVVALSGGTVATVTPGCTVSSTAATRVQYSLSPEQTQNAAIIAAVAFQKGLPDHAVTIALATSLQESGLQNLPYGDRDSVGLFQQRPSEGWGSRTQLLDPSYAAAAFYNGLAKVPGWGTMAVTEAAQAVQLSADPSAYADWEDEARALAVALTGEVPAGLSCRFSSYTGAVPAPGALGQALSREMGDHLLGATLPVVTGWKVASWVVAHAYAYHVRSVSFAGQVWQSTTGRWSTLTGQPAADVVTVGGG